MEIGLFGSGGSTAWGQLCFTLTATDIDTGWTVNPVDANKAQKCLFEALQHAEARCPSLPIAVIDSERGTEFINDYLRAYLASTFPSLVPGQ